MSASNQGSPRSSPRRSSPRSGGAGSGSTARAEHSTTTSPPSRQSRTPVNGRTADARQHPSASTSQTPRNGPLANGITTRVSRMGPSRSGGEAGHQAGNNDRQRSSGPPSSNSPEYQVSSQHGELDPDDDRLAAELRTLLAVDELNNPASQRNGRLGPPPGNGTPHPPGAGSRGQAGTGGPSERINGATPHGRGGRTQHPHTRGHGLGSSSEHSQTGRRTGVGEQATQLAPREATNVQPGEGQGIPTAGEVLASQLEAFRETAATLRTVLRQLGAEELYSQQDLEQLQYFDSKIADLERRLGLASEP